jgi:hypothetical protein
MCGMELLLVPYHLLRPIPFFHSQFWFLIGFSLFHFIVVCVNLGILVHLCNGRRLYLCENGIQIMDYG